jgi:hypothetical protein
MEWPSSNAIAITLRLGGSAGTSYITEESARELAARLRSLQVAMGSAQLVAGELEHQAARDPAERATLALFGEQARTIVEAIDSWVEDSPLPDDVAHLRTALSSSN